MDNLEKIKACNFALRDLRVSDLQDDRTLIEISRLKKVLIDVSALIKFKKMPLDL